MSMVKAVLYSIIGACCLVAVVSGLVYLEEWFNSFSFPIQFLIATVWFAGACSITVYLMLNASDDTDTYGW